MHPSSSILHQLPLWQRAQKVRAHLTQSTRSKRAQVPLGQLRQLTLFSTAGVQLNVYWHKKVSKWKQNQLSTLKQNPAVYFQVFILTSPTCWRKASTPGQTCFEKASIFKINRWNFDTKLSLSLSLSLSLVSLKSILILLPCLALLLCMNDIVLWCIVLMFCICNVYHVL